MSRLPALDRAAFDPDQQAVADEIINGPRKRLSSLFEVWLRHPPLCDRIRRLGDYARWDTPLPRDLAELSILVASAHFEAWPEFDAHARFALEAGIPAEVIESVRHGKRPELPDARRAITYDLLTEYFATHRVSSDTYTQAIATLGENDLVDVVGIAGYYAMVCTTINVFEISG